jgi:hypothetical protein
MNVAPIDIPRMLPSVSSQKKKPNTIPNKPTIPMMSQNIFISPF